MCIRSVRIQNYFSLYHSSHATLISKTKWISIPRQNFNSGQVIPLKVYGHLMQVCPTTTKKQTWPGKMDDTQPTTCSLHFPHNLFIRFSNRNCNFVSLSLLYNFIPHCSSLPFLLKSKQTVGTTKTNRDSWIIVSFVYECFDWQFKQYCKSSVRHV